MADRYGEFLKILADPSHYVKVADVPVFDAHREVYFVNKKGKMCAPKDPGAKKVVKEFDKKELQKIAHNCNERDSTGTLSPITKGHTIPDEHDESKQPEIMGYAKDYHVRWDQRLKKWVIAANYFLRADCEKEARSYPRTSVELWPGDDVIDPIALLRRTPARDLGQWSYGKSQFHRAAGSTVWRFSRAGRPVLRYSMETKPMAEPWEDDAAAPADTGDSGAPFGEDTDEPAQMEQFVKHCMSHPHAMKYAKQYAMPAEDATAAPPEDATAVDPAMDPTMPPDAAPPLMNKKKGGVARYRKEGADKRLEEALQREAEAEGRNWVLRLSDVEGIAMDENKEVLQFAKAFRHSKEEGCEKYANHLRTYHKERIDRPVGRVRTAQAPVRHGKESVADHQRALQYQKDHPDVDWDDAEIAVKNGKK